MEVILVLLFILLVVGQALFFDRVFKLPPHLTPLLAILFDTLILYMFGLANLLVVGRYYVLVMSALMGVAAIVLLIMNRFKDVTVMPYAVFGGVAIIVYSSTRGMIFTSWDEFSHWGLIYRYLMTVQALPVNLNNVIVSYPPASPLWQYFTAKIIGFSEANAYFAHLLIQFTAIIALFPIKKWSDWWKVGLVLLIAVLSPFAINMPYAKLYVDLLLALLLGVGFAQSLVESSYTMGNFAAALLAACAVVLVKPTGILLAMILVLVNSIAIVFVKTRVGQNPVRFIGILRAVLDYRIALLLILPIAAYLSWSQFSSQYNVNAVHFQAGATPLAQDEIFPSDPNAYIEGLKKAEADSRLTDGLLMTPVEKQMGLGDIFRSFTIDSPYRTKLIAEKFVSTFSNSILSRAKVTLKVAFVVVIVAIALVTAILRGAGKKTRSIYLTANGLLLVGFILYAVSLYVSYIIIFTPAEAIKAPSLGRYLGTYLLAWWLANLSMIYRIGSAPVAKRNFALANWLLGGLACVLVFLIPTETYLHLPRVPIAAQYEAEKAYAKVSRVGFQASDKVYDVYSVLPANEGFKHYVMRYLLTPVGSNNEGWMLGKRAGENNDVYSIDLTAAEWFDILKSQGYTYVLVNQTDADFWAQYGSLFDRYSMDTTEPQLFKVTGSGLNYVQLD